MGYIGLPLKGCQHGLPFELITVSSSVDLEEVPRRREVGRFKTVATLRAVCFYCGQIQTWTVGRFEGQHDTRNVTF